MIPTKLALICALLAPSLGCKARNNAASVVKYGFLPDASTLLIHLPSGSQIGVCGAREPWIAWAINTWASAIGRTYTVVSSCSGQLINSYTSADAFAKQQCVANNLVGRGYAQPALQPQQIVDCGGLLAATSYLHEVGHLFGLCDQYDGVSDCASSTGAVQGSVLNAATSTTLTQDDIDGIRALAGLAPQQGAPAGDATQQQGGPTQPSQAGGLEGGAYDSPGQPRVTVSQNAGTITLQYATSPATPPQIFSNCDASGCYPNGNSNSGTYVHPLDAQSFLFRQTAGDYTYTRAFSQPQVPPP